MPEIMKTRETIHESIALKKDLLTKIKALNDSVEYLNFFNQVSTGVKEIGADTKTDVFKISVQI